MTASPHIEALQRNQRNRDLRRLREFVSDLPARHPDRAGVRRAIEVLTYLPLQYDDDREAEAFAVGEGAVPTEP